MDMRFDCGLGKGQVFEAARNAQLLEHNKRNEQKDVWVDCCVAYW